MARRTISDDLLRAAGIYYWFLPMPKRIKAYTQKHQDVYLVYLNEALSEKTLYQTLDHELAHIELGHLDSDVLTVDEMEREVADIDFDK